MPKQLFLNLPVKDLKKTTAFFTKLGFSFNPQFTDENAACMIVGENIFVMLLVEKFFKTFIQKPLADARQTTGALIALSVSSRIAVDSLMGKALAAGATEARAPQDHGWMYGRSFEDLNGHIWEIFFMDAAAMPHK